MLGNSWQGAWGKHHDPRERETIASSTAFQVVFGSLRSDARCEERSKMVLPDRNLMHPSSSSSTANRRKEVSIVTSRSTQDMERVEHPILVLG